MKPEMYFQGDADGFDANLYIEWQGVAARIFGTAQKDGDTRGRFIINFYATRKLLNLSKEKVAGFVVRSAYSLL